MKQNEMWNSSSKTFLLPAFSFCSPHPHAYIWMFLKIILSVLGQHPHRDGFSLFSHQNLTFFKTLSRVDLQKMLLSSGQMKMELFETPMSHHQFITFQSMCFDLWGSREGILMIYFWIFNIIVFFVDWDNFKSDPCVDTVF